MSDWVELNLSNIKPVAQGLDAASGVLDTVASTASTIAGGIKTVADNLIDITDAARAAIQATCIALRAIVGDTLNTGVYFYYDTAGWPFLNVRAGDADSARRAMSIDWDQQVVGPEIANGTAAERFAQLPESERIAIQRGMPLAPFARPVGFDGWYAKFQQSLADEGDSERPQFSPHANVAALFFIAGMPSLPDFLALLQLLGDLLGIGPFTRALDNWAATVLIQDAAAGDELLLVQDASGFLAEDAVVVGMFSDLLVHFNHAFEVDQDRSLIFLDDPLPQAFAKGTPVAMCGGTLSKVNRLPTAPDWWNTTVRDVFPVLQELEDLIEQLIALLNVASGFLEMLKQLAAALKLKAEQFEALVLAITAFIEKIIQIIRLAGVYILPVRSDAGVAGLLEKVDEAKADLPLPADSFVMGACLLGGATNFTWAASLLGVEI